MPTLGHPHRSKPPGFLEPKLSTSRAWAGRLPAPAVALFEDIRNYVCILSGAHSHVPAVVKRDPALVDSTRSGALGVT